MKTDSRIVVGVLVVTSCSAIAFFALQRPQVTTHGSQKSVMNDLSVVDPPRGNILTSQTSDYFTYSDNAFGPQFGETDRWGIDEAVLNQYSNRIDEFRTIATTFAARRQWLKTNNYDIPDDANWLVYVTSVGLVNQQLRVLVSARIGKMEIDERGIDVNCPGGVEEIWAIAQGTEPQLLDRSDLPFEQLYTHQESPVVRVDFDRLIGEPLDIGDGKTFPRQPNSTQTPESAPPLP